MTITKYIFLYLIAIPVFFLIDIFWIGFVADKMYWKHLGHLRSETVNWPAAIAFYSIFIAGIIYFAIRPAVESGNWQTALINGALFGFFTYATYDLTNMATLKNWPLVVTIADIVWGIFLCGSVALATYLIGQRFIF